MAEMFTANDGPGTKRAEIFRFIVEYKLAHDGCAPSYDEIINRVGVVKTTVVYHLRRLAQLGMINFVPGYRRNRMIEIEGGYLNAREKWPEFFEGEL